MLLLFMAPCLTTSMVIWLSGTLGGACSCAAHAHGGMFNSFGRDLADRYQWRSVQLCCSRP